MLYALCSDDSTIDVSPDKKDSSHECVNLYVFIEISMSRYHRALSTEYIIFQNNIACVSASVCETVYDIIYLPHIVLMYSDFISSSRHL